MGRERQASIGAAEPGASYTPRAQRKPHQTAAVCLTRNFVARLIFLPSTSRDNKNKFHFPSFSLNIVPNSSIQNGIYNSDGDTNTTTSPPSLHEHDPAAYSAHPRRRSAPVQNHLPDPLHARSAQDPSLETIPAPDPRPATDAPACPARSEMSGEASARGRQGPRCVGRGLGE